MTLQPERRLEARIPDIRAAPLGGNSLFEVTAGPFVVCPPRERYRHHSREGEATMAHPLQRRHLGIALAIPMIFAIGSAPADRPIFGFECLPVRQGQGVTADPKVIADFTERVQTYVDLHKKLEASLPSLPKEATPEQIDGNQRALAALIRSARATAKRGDIFTPAMTVYVKGLLKRVFSRPEGRQLRASIMDEYPGRITLQVNGRYPDTVPIASMPPEVLAALPKLVEELEYRFVGEQFILLDPHAHIIIDFVPGALPTTS